MQSFQSILLFLFCLLSKAPSKAFWDRCLLFPFYWEVKLRKWLLQGLTRNPLQGWYLEIGESSTLGIIPEWFLYRAAKTKYSLADCKNSATWDTFCHTYLLPAGKRVMPTVELISQVAVPFSSVTLLGTNLFPSLTPSSCFSASYGHCSLVTLLLLPTATIIFCSYSVTFQCVPGDVGYRQALKAFLEK